MTQIRQILLIYSLWKTAGMILTVAGVLPAVSPAAAAVYDHSKERAMSSVTVYGRHSSVVSFREPVQLYIIFF